MAVKEPQGYWVGEEFVESGREKALTVTDLQRKAGVDTARQLIAIASDGTWSLVGKEEQLTPQKYVRYENVPSFIYG
ncbi:MAG: hypothetical protein SGJ24_15560 [Chloroflexota bacterium]|nr:hypothetical protein [Chloroflexota bacterium]